MTDRHRSPKDSDRRASFRPPRPDDRGDAEPVYVLPRPDGVRVAVFRPATELAAFDDDGTCGVFDDEDTWVGGACF